MLPIINAFKTTHSLSDVTVVADACDPRSQPDPRCRPFGLRVDTWTRRSA